MKDPDSRVRASTATALGSLGSDAQAGMDLLISSTLSDSSEYVRDRAGTALWQVEPRGERVSQAMVQALRIPEKRQAAAGALEKIDPRAVAAGTYLSSGLRDPTPEVAIVCARALGKMGPSAKAQVPSLIEALKSSSQSVLFNAIEALGNIGPDASAAMPALVDLTTRASEREIRDAAASALWRLGPAAVPLLLEAVADSGRRVGAQAALFRFDPEMTEVAPYLVPALDNSNYEIRRQAAMSLTRLDSPTPEAVPALIRMLAEPELDFRFMASRMLGKLGPAAKAAVPALRRAEKDPSDVVGNAAREALVKIEGAPSPLR
jgi:HEAT repeat protein